jgi:hypothetical protein
MTFRAGQKVVCVRTWHNSRGYGDEVGPVEGEVYTIRGVGDLHPCYPGGCDVWLVEIKNPVRYYPAGNYEPSFCHSRFRPIVERKTDISIFTKMLTPEGVDA